MKHWQTCTNIHRNEYEMLVKQRDSKIAAFLHFDIAAGVDVAAHEKTSTNVSNSELPTQDLKDLPFAVKDNIAIRSMPLTCGSQFLKNFIAPYNATVISRLLKHGAIPVGKTNLDEFAMGSSTDNSALGQTHNPWDVERVCGGSSGGSAAAVASGLVPFALGSDTGGSIRQPAGFCGIYGLKPTYGTVSRYGLVAYASSLDVIGPLSTDLNLTKTVFEIIRGQDEMDHTSIDFIPGNIKNISRIGILDNIIGNESGTTPSLSENISTSYKESIEYMRHLGYEIRNVHIPSLKYSVAAYYTIAMAEASTNLARFNGIRYGQRPAYAENLNELVRRSRRDGFGDEVKLRILLGTYVLRSGFQNRYYQKAQQIRRKIKQDINSLFSHVDVILMPVYPVQAFRHNDPGINGFQQKLAEHFTTIANLTGLPALSCPAGVADGLPCAVQFMAPPCHEHLLFEAAEKLQSLFPQRLPQGYECRFSLNIDNNSKDKA